MRSLSSLALPLCLAASVPLEYLLTSLPFSSLQFAQWSLDPSFRLFDYGTKAANRQHYGSDRPPSVAGEGQGGAGLPVASRYT